MKITGELKYFLNDDEHDYAQLKFSDTNGRLVLETIIVPKSMRDQGVGTTLACQLLDLADMWEKDVYLTARPIGVGSGSSGNLDKLIRFYSRLGFAELDRGVSQINMVRRYEPPNAKMEFSPPPDPG